MWLFCHIRNGIRHYLSGWDVCMDSKTVLKIMSDNSIRNPIKLVVIGLIGFLIGLALFGYTWIRYLGWERVDVTYEDHNCQTESEEGGKKVILCDRTISYVYEGKTYHHTLTQIDQNMVNPSTRLVDPEHPDSTDETMTSNVIASIFTFGGLLFILGAVVEVRRKYKQIQNISTTLRNLDI